MAAEKATGSRSTSKKGASKKGVSKKSAGKSSTSKKPSSATSKRAASKRSSSGPRRAEAPRAAAPAKKPARKVAEAAVEQLSELIGKEIEGVTGIMRTDDGWTVDMDVLELRRIPNTTDVLAAYEVTMSESGDLEGYRRQGRYVRGSTTEGRA